MVHFLLYNRNRHLIAQQWGGHPIAHQWGGHIACLLWVQHPVCVVTGPASIKTLRPRQNGRHFADDTFKYIFLDENVIILAKISQKFVPKGPINNIPALVQIMAWRRPGAKPLYEPMMVRLRILICVTRPQWFNTSPPGQFGGKIAAGIFKCIFINENICNLIKISLKFVPKGSIDNKSALVQVMAWPRTGGKPLPAPMLS